MCIGNTWGVLRDKTPEIVRAEAMARAELAWELIYKQRGQSPETLPRTPDTPLPGLSLTQSSLLQCVQLSLTRIYAGRCCNWTTGSLSLMGGSSRCKMMSTISPWAPLVTSKSVSMLSITRTFIPFAISILHGRAFHFCLPWVFGHMATAYLSSRINSQPPMVSSVVQMKSWLPDSLHAFLTADLFQIWHTACQGVTRGALDHGLDLKSTCSLVWDLWRMRLHRIWMCCSWICPWCRCTSKSCQTGSITHICSFKMTTVWNSS